MPPKQKSGATLFLKLPKMQREFDNFRDGGKSEFQKNNFFAFKRIDQIGLDPEFRFKQSLPQCSKVGLKTKQIQEYVAYKWLQISELLRFFNFMLTPIFVDLNKLSYISFVQTFWNYHNHFNHV